jgi:hypothetical protein
VGFGASCNGDAVVACSYPKAVHAFVGGNSCIFCIGLTVDFRHWQSAGNNDLITVKGNGYGFGEPVIGDVAGKPGTEFLS